MEYKWTTEPPLEVIYPGGGEGVDSAYERGGDDGRLA